MAHKTLIDGTAYEISGGKTLIDGAVYEIKNGKTLIDGAVYEVGFNRMIQITITGYGGLGIGYGGSAYATIDGQNYYNSITNSSIVYVTPGTVITCTVAAQGTSETSTISLNGTIVASVKGGLMTAKTISYSYTVNAPITITLYQESKFATLDITET